MFYFSNIQIIEPINQFLIILSIDIYMFILIWVDLNNISQVFQILFFMLRFLLTKVKVVE